MKTWNNISQVQNPEGHHLCHQDMSIDHYPLVVYDYRNKNFGLRSTSLLPSFFMKFNHSLWHWELLKHCSMQFSIFSVLCPRHGYSAILGLSLPLTGKSERWLWGWGERCWQVLWGQCAHRKHIHVCLTGYFPAEILPWIAIAASVLEVRSLLWVGSHKPGPEHSKKVDAPLLCKWLGGSSVIFPSTLLSFGTVVFELFSRLV